MRVAQDLLQRARRLVAGDALAVLGVAGAPGSGKTTLAVALVEALAAETGAETVTHVPMDGFHLADVTLRRLGSLQRKGAPDTFDAWGYAALLERLRGRRRHPDETVYAPGFERELEQPVAGAVAVGPRTRLVVTEGNYLLLDEPAWRAARSACDEVWFVQADEARRRQRLVARHVEFGKSPAAAAAWVDAVDEPNAVAVAATRDRADLVVTPDAAGPSAAK